ncbi:MAG: transglutaminase domain-containing protein [Bacteroidetes bacterium]|nr:transglutaminase domain-containing protein [Bacteroidota bacterium]
MKQIEKLLIFLILIVFYSCTENHLIPDKEYREVVEKSFAERKQLAKNREKELFSVFNNEISEQQSEAMKFLYAFMPLNDLADYSGEFFLANADLSIKAREEATWGKTIPADIFLHYILPVRVNNENLDSFRIVYYDEIMSRIGMLNLKEAALEINHWCHEKVNYQAADIRTSSPMATILSARGRCGEESTFTVAALRTAGIPARQVYTPRWAHSDDNHAWVEIWDKGEWFYLGACEPEPVLDRGWFTEPARRAMLVHTKSFGAPYGKENRINSFRFYSEVNNLAKYAVTKKY